VEKIRHLRWLGPILARPWLWHLNRHTVALGLAVGVFIGFLIPMGLQAPVAALLAVWLRGNLAAAILSTLVTNPFTVAPIYFAAYKLGSFVTGYTPALAPTEVSVVGKIVAVGGPLMVGLTFLAVLGAGIAYFGTHALWRLIATRAWQRRLRTRAARRRAEGAMLLATEPPQAHRRPESRNR
jgi:uncharacterized protein (DUF2062 family)